MRTTYTLMAILASVVFTQSASAKLGFIRSTVQFESTIGINIETEIANNIIVMLANVQAPAIQTDLVKKLNMETAQSQTNGLIKNVNETLPEFEVVIAE